MNANKQDAAEELKDEPKMSPLEMEEGRTGQKAEPAKGKGAAALACMRKYWCPLVTLLVLAIALAILIPILKYRPIQAEYLDTSKVALRQSRIHMDINIKFHNPNVYPVEFSDVALNVYNFQNVHIGTASRAQKTKLPAGKTTIVPFSADLTPSIPEIAAMGIDCMANENHTKIRTQGTVKVRSPGLKINMKVPPQTTSTMCLVLKSDAPDAINVAPGISLPPINIGPIHVGGNGVSINPPANQPNNGK